MPMDSPKEETEMAAAPPLISTTSPRFVAGEFGTISSLQNWLNTLQDYRIITIAPITMTNHFSKETETVVWAIAERNES